MTCLSNQGRHGEALELAAAVLDAPLRTPVAAAEALVQVAAVCRRAGRLDDALAHARQAAALLDGKVDVAMRAQIEPHVRAPTLALVADLELQRGDEAAASVAFAEALVALRWEAAEVTSWLSFRRFGATPREAFDALARHARGYGTPSWPGGWLDGLGAMLLERGHFDEAARAYEAALRVVDAAYHDGLAYARLQCSVGLAAAISQASVERTPSRP